MEQGGRNIKTKAWFASVRGNEVKLKVVITMEKTGKKNRQNKKQTKDDPMLPNGPNSHKQGGEIEILKTIQDCITKCLADQTNQGSF